MIILDNGKHKIETSGRFLDESELARSWRDNELASTDWVVPTTDHPQHAEYLVYRQALRDWPATSDFPLVKPTL